ncbi:hypothetical protein [Pararhodobacter zhoushanensis]|uniref:hypothetical protein n=1 Tax=Pararhodobacter zhoushanensis TaxID=2479545 RepID=UPI000F8E6EDF|nr:hypothetical protein [Pararhodobacter zhoushanensis]
MSFTQRSIIAELVSSLIVVALFAWLITTRHAAGAFDGPEGLTQWARQVLWMIPASIAVSIVVTVLLAVAYHATTRAKFDDLVDERDRMITGWGWKVTAIVISAGFVAALAALAWGASAFLALNLMLGAFALGDLSGNAAKLLRYGLGD